MMRIEEATPGTQVIYVPMHAKGDVNHPDCEEGFITSHNEHYVFCRFWSKYPGRENELRTTTCSEAVSPERLIKKETRPQSLINTKFAEIDKIWNTYPEMTLGDHDPRFA